MHEKIIHMYSELIYLQGKKDHTSTMLHKMNVHILH
jgi:hypothetical protein